MCEEAWSLPEGAKAAKPRWKLSPLECFKHERYAEMRAAGSERVNIKLCHAPLRAEFRGLGDEAKARFRRMSDRSEIEADANNIAKRQFAFQTPTQCRPQRSQSQIVQPGLHARGRKPHESALVQACGCNTQEATDKFCSHPPVLIHGSELANLARRS